MSSPTPNTSSNPGLLFIPDITGFTKFVTETEATHAQHIVSELLDVLIEANNLNLEISEIEGDAILFYRFGKAPEAGELLAQVNQMFVAFHAQLKKYETQRICHCGACRSAQDLTLKFVAHYGEFSKNQIREHQKLFGREVIVVHRLLKNDIEHHEYLMITDPLKSACHTYQGLGNLAWDAVDQGEEQYDSGKIQYHHLALNPLYKHVPEPQAKDFSVPGVQVDMGHCETTIEAPMEMVFNVLLDLPFRNQWQDGLDPNWEIDHLNNKIVQNGSTHRCFNKGPVIVSHDFEQANDIIRYTDTITKDGVATVVTLRRIGKQLTHLRIDIFMKRNLFKQLIFQLIFQKKMIRSLKKSYQTLNNYCKDLLQKGEEHPYSIILPASSKAAVTG